MKKILIMGAGIYQVPLIEAAKRMGLYTIVASIPGNYPGFALADRVCYINTTDQEAILEVAREEAISGICTAGTDVAVATIGYVNQQMGLSGVSRQAAAKTSDKTLMQDAFKAGGVASAKHIRADSPQAARKAAAQIGYPVVVKCVDSSGSRGISIVEREEELIPAFEDALNYSRRPYALVEQKLNGKEIGIDGIVSGGELIFLAPHQKFTWQSGETVITAGHDFPYRGSDALMEDIRRQTSLAIRALGLDNCAVNLDAFVDGDRLYVIEIGGRSGATCIPELISMHYGFDYYEAILRLALGQRIDFGAAGGSADCGFAGGGADCGFTESCEGTDPKDHLQPCKARLIMSPVGGVITGIDEAGLEALRGSGVRIGLDYPVGARIEAMRNGTDRLGQVIAAAEEEEQMRQIMEKVCRCIELDGQDLQSLWEQAEAKA